ncbi:hypothetical protein PoB_004258100 [Plakobranchus ocellatus]|uniref:Uncharacterized protein n=1 Tax=Plakobranchus ocellatus TaxID=259542 RepID=A0AAV4AY89_9GAST|nr:hypothetical protein PoB_004258100 [Plakobranchus ocellatus]
MMMGCSNAETKQYCELAQMAHGGSQAARSRMLVEMMMPKQVLGKPTLELMRLVIADETDCVSQLLCFYFYQLQDSLIFCITKLVSWFPRNAMMMGCSNAETKQYCELAQMAHGGSQAARSRMLVEMMMPKQVLNQFEQCLTPNTLMSSVSGMFGGVGGYNPYGHGFGRSTNLDIYELLPDHNDREVIV